MMVNGGQTSYDPRFIRDLFFEDRSQSSQQGSTVASVSTPMLTGERPGMAGEELYDHTNDPNEWKNLVFLSQYKSTIEELKMHLPERDKR